MNDDHHMYIVSVSVGGPIDFVGREWLRVVAYTICLHDVGRWMGMGVPCAVNHASYNTRIFNAVIAGALEVDVFLSPFPYSRLLSFFMTTG